jgi:post-segregation antitoxin (ccd killing protein)
MNRPRATAQLHVRIPPAEKQELREQARRYGVSMSALVRIEMLAAQRRRRREHELQLIYPQSLV